jgi:hypothetical protein
MTGLEGGPTGVCPHSRTIAKPARPDRRRAERPRPLDSAPARAHHRIPARAIGSVAMALAKGCARAIASSSPRPAPPCPARRPAWRGSGRSAPAPRPASTSAMTAACATFIHSRVETQLALVDFHGIPEWVLAQEATSQLSPDPKAGLLRRAAAPARPPCCRLRSARDGGAGGRDRVRGRKAGRCRHR